MGHELLVVLQNVEIFSIMPDDRDGLYPVLPLCWKKYECHYPLFIPTQLFSPYYGIFFLRGGSDDIPQIDTLVISKVVDPVGVLCLLCATKGCRRTLV